MESRRAFIKKASLLAGATAAFNFLPDSIQKALAIDAQEGSTYLDAEHIVFLMQENRSFDHCFGSLKGVRGFNDPRALQLSNGLPIWVQTNKKGQHFAPFHLDIVRSKSTWMGSLPHGWRDMVAARNYGLMDNWLDAKSPGPADFKNMPLTMGYYNRADIPFYYAFADAFTVCDQHFCASLTGTSANRSHFWSGTVRENPRDPHSIPHVDNGQINYKDVGWKTYPERLEEAGISWKVYQNELSIPVGLEGEAEEWLTNFTDNNLEFHKQYGVRYHPAHVAFMEEKILQLKAELRQMDEAADRDKQRQLIAGLERDIVRFSKENFNLLSPQQQAIHRNAFVTNKGDLNYHKTKKIAYNDGQRLQEVEVPAGDVFYQFRKDVDENKLPTVSWLVAPCRFSDHPGSPWYGAWYLSEALDILTKNPEIWKKTIFILTYDENDGYFDHVPPFVPPLTTDPDTGAVSKGLRTEDEYVTQEQERARTGKAESILESPIGLGFRVPMVVASPWTKGGWVNSEVFDLTSNIQFLEHFLFKKTGKRIVETNISDWRRLVTGDLTSVFRKVEKSVDLSRLKPLDHDAYIERIYRARSQKLPSDFVEIREQQLDEIRVHGLQGKDRAVQEPGTKPSNALPYRMEVNARMDGDGLQLDFAVQESAIPRHKVMGVPFYAVSYQSKVKGKGQVWNFAVQQGKPVSYAWNWEQFDTPVVRMRVYGPNGFYRSFTGHRAKRHEISVKQDLKSKDWVLLFEKHNMDFSYRIKDNSYDLFAPQVVESSFSGPTVLSFAKSKGWYDLEITCLEDPDFSFHFAGRLENGAPSITDPLMAG